MNVKEQYWKYSLIAIILILGLIIFIKIMPFMGGLLGAITIYTLLRNQMRYFTVKRRWKRSIAAILLLLETVLLFLIPLSLAVWLVINKVQSINLDPQAFIGPIDNFAALIRERIGYDVLANDNLSSVVSFLPRLGQALMGGIGSFVVNVFVLIFVLYFMLIGGDKMENYVNDLLPFNSTNKKHILNEINMIVKSNAIGIPLLGIIQGGIAVAGYYIFQAPSPLLLGFLTCFATIIPIVGTALIWLPIVVYMGLSGDWVHAIGLLIYASLVITQVDNLIRFVLQKKLADIHPLITIFGVVIGLSLFGFMGIIFGPLLLSLFILCVNIFKTQYLERKTGKFTNC